MTEIEARLKHYEDFGYKLYKYYAEGEEQDPELPSIDDYLSQLYEELSKELSVLSEDKVDTEKLREVKFALCKVKKWSRRNEKASDYCLARTFSDCNDLSILPIDRKSYEVVVPVVKGDTIEITKTGEQVQVYIVPVLGTHHNDYVPLEETDVIIMPPYLVEGQPYIHVRDQIINESHVCPQCGKIFKVSYKQGKAFEKHGLKPPKRCVPCRKRGCLS